MPGTMFESSPRTSANKDSFNKFDLLLAVVMTLVGEEEMRNEHVGQPSSERSGVVLSEVISPHSSAHLPSGQWCTVALEVQSASG
jgi:hypothetical protein